MKAFVFRGAGRLEIAELAEPEPGPGELLIRPHYVGLCFTDKHSYGGSPGYLPGIVLGHEASGEVAGIGADVDGWKIGDRIALSPQLYCGQCSMCRSGWYIHCRAVQGWIGCYGQRADGTPHHGMAAEYCAVPAYTCYRVPANVSAMAAANVEAVACGTRAVRLSGMAIGDDVVILGAEDYDLSVLQWVRRGGARQVVVADPLPIRREVARKLGADEVLDPADPDFVARVRERMPLGADHVFAAMEDYVPASFSYLRQAFEIARVQGSVGILRAYSERAFHGLAPVVAWTKEITVRHFGVCFGEEPWRGGRERGDFQLSIEAIAAGQVDAESHVTRIVAFDDVRTAADLDEVYGSLPEREVKVLFRI